jgi:serine protease AprX
VGEHPQRRRVARTRTLVVIVALATSFASAVPLAAAAPAEVVDPISAFDAPALRLRSGDLVPAASGNGAAAVAAMPGGKAYYVVQFDGPIAEESRLALEKAKAEIVEYLPDFAYKVRADRKAAQRAVALPHVVWVGPFDAGFKVGPEILDAGVRVVAVRLEKGVDKKAAGEAIAASGATVIDKDGKVFLLAADAAQIRQIAEVADVAFVEGFGLRETHNEYGAGVIAGTVAAAAAGYDGTGQTVAVADTGLGDGTAAGAHAGIAASRVAQIHNWSGTSNGCYDIVNDGARDVDTGHGTHVAGSALGNGDATGLGRGAAPGASLVFQAVENYAVMKGYCATVYEDGYLLVGLPADLSVLFEQAYAAGARIHSNSWGSDARGAYTADSAAVDEYVWEHPDFTVLFSAGNEGTDGNGDGVVDPDSIGSPATAKNAITVGASENDRDGHYPCDTALGGCSGQNSVFTYGAGWGGSFGTPPLSTDASAGNAEQVAAFSSRGPTNDGRIKPDLVAPGTWVLSSFSDLYRFGYDAAPNPQSGLWQYDGWGLPASAGYKYMGGTSMATPIVAGAAASVRQFYAASGVDASAALVKATLINSAHDLLDENNDGVADNRFPIPNVHEGWGRVDAAAATDGTAEFIEGPVVVTSASHAYAYTVYAGSAFKATLAWSDYPSSISVATNLVNDLDLVVEAPDGTIYRGNAFAGGWAVPDADTPDRVNNVENVFVPNAAPGTWKVLVEGYNVPIGPQRYALVVDGVAGEASADAAPSATVIAPAAGATVAGTVDIVAVAVDDDAVVSVEFLVAGDTVGTDTDGADGWSTSWDSVAVADGPVDLVAVATDTIGQSAPSVPVTVVVDNPDIDTTPSIAITSPADGATVSRPVTVSADAFGALGIASVGLSANTGWNLLASAGGELHEYTLAGDLVAERDIPYGGGGTRPSSETSRDVAVDAAGAVHVYDGTLGPYLSTRAGGDWSHRTLAGWNTVNNISYGGLAAHGDAVFATDMATSGETTQRGIVRFAPTGIDRFATTTDFIDVTAGLDGIVYGLASDQRDIRLFDPDSLAALGTIRSSVAIRAIAVDAEGRIFAAAWNGSIYELSRSGAVLNAASFGPLYLLDIDVAPTGAIAVGSWFHGAVLTDRSLASAEILPFPSRSFVAFAPAAETIGVDTDGSDGWQVIWDAADVADGPYRVSALATDTTGQTASATIDIVLDSAAVDAPPSVTLVAPQDGATVSGSVTVVAEPVDDLGVDRVEFSVDGTLVGADGDGSDGWSVAWDSTVVGDGVSEVSAVAVDSAGQVSAPDAVSVVVDNVDLAPTVALVAPADGATVAGVVTLAADATDDRGVDRVEFSVDGTLVGADGDGSDGWSVAWDSTVVGDGVSEVSAVAVDSAGQVSAPDAVSVVVDNVDLAPTVALVAPADGATVAGVVTVAADAADDNGVDRVEFMVDGIVVGSDDDGGDGWSIDWDSTVVPDGAHGIEAVAVDTAGQVSAADGVTVEVDNVDLAPTVALVAPADGATVAGVVTVAADAADDKGVDRVEFMVDGIVVGSDDDGGDGWSIEWDSTVVPDGAHGIEAVAVDTAGQVSPADGVTVEVDNVDLAPTVVLTAPADGTVVAGMVTLVAEAADDRGVDRVEFSVDGTVVGADGDGSDGWSVEWDSIGVADGAYEVSAVAVDSGGQVSAPDAVSVEVDNVDLPPEVTLVAPTAGATVAGLVSLVAEASDDKGIVRVEFFVDGSLVATDASVVNGWWVEWDSTGIADGTYEVSAVAVDTAGQRTGSGSATVEVDNVDLAPTVVLTAPADGTVVAGMVTLVAEAADDRGVDRVEFSVDGTVVGADGDGSDGWSVEWDSIGVADGAYEVSAVAVDSGGQMSAPDTVSVEVDNVDLPPEVALTSPAAGTTLAGTVQLVADATDDEGVVRVEFLLDGALLAVDVDGADGWSVLWATDTVADGAYVLEAVAVDTTGQSTTSDPVAVAVDNVDLIPVVDLTAPAGGSLVLGTVSLVAAASDDVGVSRVDFLVDGEIVATDADPANGWAVDWDSTTVADGEHEIAAVAVDTAGQASMPSAATVEVDNVDLAPTVVLTAPKSGDTLSGTTILAAAASDDVAVARVEFSVDGVLAGSDTDGSDGWTVEWDTTAAAEGPHVVTVVAVDTAGQRSPSDGASITVSNAAPSAGVHVGDIDGVGANWYYWWAAVVTITVHDEAEQAVAGATVTVSWDGSVAQTCVTSTAGTCTLSRWFSRSVVSTVAVVTNVAVPDRAYVPGANHDPDGSSDGTTIRVSRP